MGLRTSRSAEIVFTDCEVPVENRLGGEGQGLKIALEALDSGRVGIAAQAVGIAQGAFEEAVRYARQRRAFGKTLGEFQAIQWMLADMQTEIEAARSLTYYAAWLRDAGSKRLGPFASRAKLYASEMANRVVYKAVQVHGSVGYSRETDVERMYRDARVLSIYEGTSEIQRMIIARDLLSPASEVLEAAHTKGAARVPQRKRVLSGMRPTGRLHIGHYFGALSNWIRMQEEYDCFFFVADWHALTTDYADASEITQNTLEIAADWLAAGLEPAKCTMFVQSQVPVHAELHLLLSTVTPLGWLERVPTYKEQLANITDKDLHTYGFLGYPLLQAADIVIHDADLVPVGEDQVPHIELTREIVRRFNAAYGHVDWKKAKPKSLVQLEKQLQIPASAAEAKSEEVHRRVDEAMRQLSLDHRLSLLANAKVPMQKVLREPAVMLTETPRLPGTDGRKMSKSYGNVIELGESDNSIRAKTKVMMTDPARKRREDPGNPEVCPVFSWHNLFSPAETIAWSDQGCRTAGIGCIECKAAMADNLIRWIEPIRARRQEYEANAERVSEILREGSGDRLVPVDGAVRTGRGRLFAY
jgi:tryptophanyl-tRNA synthetase